jgi:hypothetical protein
MNGLNRVASLKDREVTKKLTEAALENHADRFFGRHVRRKRGGRRADRFRGLARQQFRGAPGLAENGGRQGKRVYERKTELEQGGWAHRLRSDHIARSDYGLFLPALASAAGIIKALRAHGLSVAQAIDRLSR